MTDQGIGASVKRKEDMLTPLAEGQGKFALVEEQHAGAH